MKRNAFKVNLFFIIAAVALSAAFYCIYHPYIPRTSFDIDEADYMYALEKGFTVHYFDRNTMTIVEYMKTGLSKGMNKDKRSELSKIARSGDDVNLYRHFHGPLYFYYMMLGRAIVGKNETAIRSFSAVLQLLCSLLFLAGCLWLFGVQAGKVPAVLSAMLVLFSPILFYTVSLVSPHGLYVLLCLATLVILVKAVDTRRKRYFYLSAITVALASLTLEYAFVLLFSWLAGVVIVYRMDRNAFGSVPRFLTGSIGLMAGVIFILWPASLIKLSFIKGYLWQAYLILVRYPRDHSMPILKFWAGRIAESPLEFALAGAGIALAIYALLKKRKIALVPVIVYVLLVFLMEIRHFASAPTYMSSLLAAGYLALGTAMAYLFPRKIWMPVALTATAGIALFLFLHQKYLPRLQSDLLEIRTEITAILRKEMPKKVLVHRSLISLVHYYFRDDMQADSFTPEHIDKQASFAEIREYLTRNGDYEAVIYFGPDADTVAALTAERYSYEKQVFTRPGWADQWVYFRLKQKSVDVKRQ